MPDDISFVWPTSGVMHVTSVAGGGCNIKFTFADRGMVRSIGKGRILTTRKIATKRIAEQYEIIIRHDGDFESNYSIIDRLHTPRQKMLGGCAHWEHLSIAAVSSTTSKMGARYTSSFSVPASLSTPDCICANPDCAGDNLSADSIDAGHFCQTR